MAANNGSQRATCIYLVETNEWLKNS